MEIPFCGPINALYLILSPNVPAFVYYSHFIAIASSLVLILYIARFNQNRSVGKVVLFTFTSFLTWVVSAIIFWASNRGDVIMFTWSLDILVEPLVYIGGFYLLYMTFEKRDLPFKAKMFLFFAYLPMLIFISTKYTLSQFDVSTCLVTEGFIAKYYTYALEALMTIIIICYSVHRYKNPKDLNKKEIVSLSAGIILFLFAFAWGNIIGSFTDNWQLGQYGLFGMPIFTGFLAYSIVKFRTFNIKLIGTQALVVALWITLFAVLFIRTIENVRVVTSLTLILFLIIGMVLIRSVKREVEQREKIEKLAIDLERANEKLTELDQMKTEFLSLATHQIRSPLTAIKGYSSMLLEGDFGELSIKSKGAIKTIFASCQHLIDIVEDFLNISRIEQGRMVYNKEKLSLKDLAKEATTELLPNAEKKGLKIDLQTTDTAPISVNADKNKLKQILHDLVDNAIKYTRAGNIEVRVWRDHEDAFVSVKDTGVGMDPKDMERLFNKFSRAKDAFKQDVTGTGLGLYIAQKMTEAHGGKITAESQGRGKGSTFTIVLPLATG